MDVVKRYDVDGIHFDYIRYPGEIGDYSYDEPTRRAFRLAYGLEAENAPERWRTWQIAQINTFLADTYDHIKRRQGNVVVSAAVLSDPEKARREFCQDAHGWLDKGILDLAVPMAYLPDPEAFRDRMAGFLKGVDTNRVCAGIGVYKLADPQELVAQLVIARELGCSGVALFAYSSLFEDHTPNAFAEATRLFFARP